MPAVTTKPVTTDWEEFIESQYPVTSDHDNQRPVTRADFLKLALLIVKCVSIEMAKSAPLPAADKWLTMDEACKFARVSRNTIKKWLIDGLIYGDKITGQWRIDRDSVEDAYNKARICKNNRKRK